MKEVMSIIFNEIKSRVAVEPTIAEVYDECKDDYFDVVLKKAFIDTKKDAIQSYAIKRANVSVLQQICVLLDEDKFGDITERMKKNIDDHTLIKLSLEQQIEYLKNSTIEKNGDSESREELEKQIQEETRLVKSRNSELYILEDRDKRNTYREIKEADAESEGKNALSGEHGK